MLKFLRDVAMATEAGKVPERRAAPRLDKIFPVWIEGDGGGAMGVARNISEGGLFVETRDPQPLGSQVRVTFPSQSGEMTAVGEVRYVCHLLGRADAEATTHSVVHGMGVRFLYFEAAADGLATYH